MDLTNDRRKRWVPEPTPSKDSVTVTVRHPTKGRIARSFNGKNSDNPHRFLNVYNWEGSLLLEPPFFSLVNYKNRIVSPEEIAEEGVLNFCPRNNLVLMSPEGEVKTSNVD